jgi:hypothetical protein
MYTVGRRIAAEGGKGVIVIHRPSHERRKRYTHAGMASWPVTPFRLGPYALEKFSSLITRTLACFRYLSHCAGDSRSFRLRALFLSCMLSHLIRLPALASLICWIIASSTSLHLAVGRCSSAVDGCRPTQRCWTWTGWRWMSFRSCEGLLA